METAKCPCIGCIYFDACGDEERTMPCSGRETNERNRRVIKKEKRVKRSDVSPMYRRNIKQEILDALLMIAMGAGITAILMFMLVCLS